MLIELIIIFVRMVLLSVILNQKHNLPKIKKHQLNPTITGVHHAGKSVIQHTGIILTSGQEKVGHNLGYFSLMKNRQCSLGFTKQHQD